MSMSSASRSASAASPISISTLTACSWTLVGPNTVYITFASPVTRAAGHGTNPLVVS